MTAVIAESFYLLLLVTLKKERPFAPLQEHFELWQLIGVRNLFYSLILTPAISWIGIKSLVASFSVNAGDSLDGPTAPH